MCCALFGYGYIVSFKRYVQFIYPYASGLLGWYWGKCMTASVSKMILRYMVSIGQYNNRHKKAQKVGIMAIILVNY